ncbi:MAG: hypothetical protein Kow0027_28660 [Saprospiraceae bacterium]
MKWPLFTLAMLFCLNIQAQNFYSEITSLPPSPGAEGIAAGDYNNDGYEDLYLSFPNYPNQLWRNNGDGTFTNVAPDLGLDLSAADNTKAAIWGDIDNDGWLDLYIANKGAPDRLFKNNQGQSFTDISASAGIGQLGWPQSLNMADVNGDGFLDIYVANFQEQNLLLLNNGDLTFSDNTIQSGAVDEGKAMGAIFFDFDKDGDADLYLVHDGNEPNLLYQNDGSGHFTEVGVSTGANTASFAMGVDIGDVNNDGWPDIAIANLYQNFLLLNDGSGTGFTDISSSAGVGDLGMGWGISFLDFDLDGQQDLYLCNDYKFSPFPNLLFRNRGDLTFEKADTTGPVCNQYQSYGNAVFDLDLDGRPDIAVANRSDSEQAQVFHNEGPSGNWIGIKLIGVQSNRQAIGARIEMTDNTGELHYDELTAGNGWLSQGSRHFLFGLGTADAITAMTIHWPSGLVQSVTPPAPGKYYTIAEGNEPQEGILFGNATATAEPQPASNISLRVMPNPSRGFFVATFKSPKAGRYLARLHTLTGRLVYEEEIEAHPGENSFSVNTTGLAPGQMLILNLTGDGWTTAVKVRVGSRE